MTQGFRHLPSCVFSISTGAKAPLAPFTYHWPKLVAWPQLNYKENCEMLYYFFFLCAGRENKTELGEHKALPFPQF